MPVPGWLRYRSENMRYSEHQDLKPLFLTCRPYLLQFFFYHHVQYSGQATVVTNVLNTSWQFMTASTKIARPHIWSFCTVQSHHKRQIVPMIVLQCKSSLLFLNETWNLGILRTNGGLVCYVYSLSIFNRAYIIAVPIIVRLVSAIQIDISVYCFPSIVCVYRWDDTTNEDLYRSTNNDS